MYIIIATILAALIISYINKPNKSPILGIYQQKSVFFPLKFIFMYCVLKLRKLSNNKKNTHKRGKLYTSEEDCAVDGPRPLHDNPLAIDAVYFNGTSSDDAALICGVARRPNNICNAFLYLKVKGEDLLLSPVLPDTTIEQNDDEHNKYHVGNIKIDVVKPMEEWRIQYNGPMKHHETLKTVDVNLDVTWRAQWNGFNYDTNMSPSGMARDVAREPWSREYFNILKEVHQTHYEQHGIVNGSVKINDTIHNITVDSVRDHSFGKFREWKNFHRYGIHYLTLANGDRISVGKICMPICFSDLTIGFICKNDTKEMIPVDYCNLKLYQHGENLTPPLDYAFQFKAGGVLYTIQVNVTDSPTFYIGNEHECRVVERLAKFTVNGIKGWGAAEWEYRNMDKDILCDDSKLK